jgi:hypothetical protein
MVVTVMTDYTVKMAATRSSEVKETIRSTAALMKIT